MINDFRCRLANLSRTGSRDHEPVVPSAFVPRVPGVNERRVRAIIFGQQPDREYVTFRTRELMQLVLSSRLSDLITAEDTRIAESFDKPLYPANWFSPKITPIGNPIGKATWLGESKTDDNRGIAASEGSVVFTGGQLVATVFRPVHSTETVSSDIVPAGNTGYRLLVTGATLGEEWRWSIHQKPIRSLGQILATLDTSLRDNVMQLLAGCGKYRERLEQSWLNRDETNEKLAVVACGLALYQPSETP